MIAIKAIVSVIAVVKICQYVGMLFVTPAKKLFVIIAVSSNFVFGNVKRAANRNFDY